MSELSVHEASILATLAQIKTGDSFPEVGERLLEYLAQDGHERARQIAVAILNPEAETSVGVRKTADGILRWARQQRNYAPVNVKATSSH